MAKKKKTTEDGTPEPERQIPDLLALLTPPGRRGAHQVEWEVVMETLAVEPVRPAEPPSPSPDPGPGILKPVLVKPLEAKETDMPRKPASLTPGKKPARPASDTVVPVAVATASPDAGAVAAAQDSFECIRADLLKCTSCELYKTRTNIVPGEGSSRARLVLIGEAPGADEDASGRPFVGRAGQHLDKILAAAGFKREDLFICNILKDRPPDNRTPTVKEMESCTPFLRRQLALIKPKIIGLLGNTAVKFVIGPEAPGITKIHGQWFDSILGIPCMPMYHPSYLLRNQSRAVGSPNWQMWQDIQALKKRYDELAD